jgi:hypothetical protein
MPGIGPEMIDWWFDWHPRRPERYRAWHPQAHLDNSLDPPPEPGEKPFWGAVHHAVEDIGDGPIRARIEFHEPVAFGFSEAAAGSGPVGTIICATVSDRRARHSAMAHVFLENGDGLMLRSHFWLGSVIRPRLPRLLSPLARASEPVLNSATARRRLLPDSTAKLLAHHCAEEYTNLVAILPGLFEQHDPEAVSDHS